MQLIILALVALTGSPQVMGLDGRLHRPLSDAGHHPELLVFISHDCPICNAYAPELKRIADKYGKAGVLISLVYAEPSLSPAAARAHSKSYGYRGISAYLDPRGVLSMKAGATITPEAALYDSEGKLVYLGRIDNSYVAFGKQRPHVTAHDLRQALDSVLAHRKVAISRTPPVGCYIASESK